MTYPPEYDQWDEDARYDCKRYRHNAADLLLDVVNVIGVRAVLVRVWADMQVHYQHFQTNPSHWHALEAHIHCIRSIARGVGIYESDIVPSVMQMCLTIGIEHTYLRYTATLMVGRYSDWINEHPATLPSLLDFVVGGFNHPEVCESACLAFKHICDGCYKYLLEKNYFDSVMGILSSSNALKMDNQQLEVCIFLFALFFSWLVLQRCILLFSLRILRTLALPSFLFSTLLHSLGNRGCHARAVGGTGDGEIPHGCGAPARHGTARRVGRQRYQDN
jgi:hypothetical protein